MTRPLSPDDLDTPAVLIDLAVVEANLRRAQAHADALGLRLRPHVKTHKLPRFAKRQVELGAVGITAQKVGEAEVMAEAGVGDVFIPYNILGVAKLRRLRALAERCALSVGADSPETVAGYAAAFADTRRPLPVLVEIDTGARRCGVGDPEAALAIAQVIDRAPVLAFGGLFTYPPKDGVEAVEAALAETKARIEAAGLPVPVVSNGGTPGFDRAGEIRSATEHRPGTYIYNDRMQVGWGAATWEDCALTVRATVVSRPTPDRAVLDAGSKALAYDPSPGGGHGRLVEHPEAVIASLSEEHAVVDLSACATRPRVGDRVSVVPNHVCVVSNLFDAVHLVEGGRVVETLPVAARGRMG